MDNSARFTRRAFAALPAAAVLRSQTSKPRLRRADSFFGLHFDLHPNDKDPALGRDVSEEMVARIVAAARPDYIQYDAKGHIGWLGWPSQVGPSAPHIAQDSLAIYRKVTAREGVALYIHFSGVWDGQAVAAHPEWARINEKGERDERNTSTFGPYVDERMIPQLREAATRYDLDGVWVDGECWSTGPDYSPAALAAWKRETGRDAAPKSKDEPHWLEWLEFNRRQFRRYVRHYVGKLHESHPKFQVASNWLYSTFVPEEPELPVDFLSGDYLGNASISTARLQARYLAQTGRPWDLMAWGFQQANSNQIGHVHKPAVQLQQEASVVLAQGGGFQVYYVPSREGHFEQRHIDTMGRLASFCRERQQVSHKSESVPQIGVVFSRHSLYRTANKLFGGWGRAEDPARGMIDAMLAMRWSVDVVPDWKLARLASSYPFLILPDWLEPAEETHRELLAYVRGGGKLLIAGAANAARWAREAGYRAVGEPADRPAFLFAGEVAGNAKGMWLDVEPGSATVLATRHPALDSTRGGKPAAVAARLGAGEVVVAPGPLGYVYAATHAPAIRDFLGKLVEPRFRPLLTVEGPPTLEVALRRQRGRVVVHLLNSTGMQVAGDFAAVDFIPEVGPVRLQLPGGAARATLHPGGQSVPVRNGLVELPRLHLHAAIEIA